MFDKLLSLIETGWDTVKFFEIINPYERGVKLRWGKFVKEVGPGVAFKWPIAGEILTDNVVPNSTALHEQTLTTVDGVSCVVRGMVIWRINNIRRILLETEDADTVLVDVVHGAITDRVISSSWSYVRSPKFIKDVSNDARLAAWKYGIDIRAVKMIDIVKAPAIRLIGER